MAKFLSDEFFSQVLTALTQDTKWAESTKNLKTSVALNVTDIGQNYILGVDNGTTTLQKAAPGAPADFTFEGTYENWCKIGRGEIDLQSAVLKGQMKFKGSLVKILALRDKLNRVADVMKEVPKDF
ncbi:MAG TPA: SCP2 sterol-binding domain-containing protein [Nitrososphaerales archaeon]|nr:SCP2 sterol-binding domain-containing protein [Nitrososphaerales archaeon]